MKIVGINEPISVRWLLGSSFSFYQPKGSNFIIEYVKDQMYSRKPLQRTLEFSHLLIFVCFGIMEILIMLVRFLIGEESKKIVNFQ